MAGWTTSWTVTTTDNTWDTADWYTFGTSWATISMPYTEYGRGFQISKEMIDDDLKPRREEEPKVNVYIVALIDTLEAEVLRWEVTLGKTDAEATSALSLTKEESKKVTQGDYALIFSKIGSYEAPKITRTREMD